jgi:hypothetical protein
MDARTGITDAQSRARILALRANAKPEAQARANRLAELASRDQCALTFSASLRRQIEVLERGQY